MSSFGIDYSKGHNPNQGHYGHEHYNYNDLRGTHRPVPHSQNNAAYQQNSFDRSRSLDQDNYEPQLGVRDLRGRFTGPNRVPSGHSGTHRSVSTGYQKRWTRPDAYSSGVVPSGLVEPGWVPGTKPPPKDENARGHYVPRGYVPPETSYSQPDDYASQYPNQPTKYTQSQFSQSAGPRSPSASSFASNYQSPATAPVTGGKPAWQGTLRQSSNPKLWETRDAESLVPGSTGGGAFHRPEPSRPDVGRAYHGPSDVQPHQPRVQTMHYAPGQAPQYQQHDPTSPQADDSDAKVVHMQYNSPLGLYSKENVQAALVGQTVGKPGEGTLMVTGGGQGRPADPRQSALAQMVHEQDHPRQPAQRTYSNPGAAQRQASHQGAPFYGDYAAVPGPPVVYGSCDNSFEAYGTSDF